MANFIDLSGLTYCGKEAQEIFSQDIYSLDIRNLGVTFMEGVKGKMKIYAGEIGDVWQEYTCPFTPQGEASLDEAYIEPVAIKVNQENCYDVFWNSFLVEQTEISLRGGIPQTFGDWYFGKLRQKMAVEYTEIAFKGDTDYSGATKEYLAVADGWEKKLKAADGAATGSTFTVDNILSQVEATVNRGLGIAADADVDPVNYKILMNKNDVRLLGMALGKICCPNNGSIFSNYAKGADGKIYIFGFEVVPTEQSKDTVIFGDPRNLVLGFDTFDSHIEYKLIDMRETTGDNMFRVIAISNIAVGVIFPDGFAYTYAE